MKVLLVSVFCIYGAGGHAKDLIAQITFDYGRGAIACLVDDFRPDRKIAEISVVDFSTALQMNSTLEWLIGVGDPFARRKISERSQNADRSEGYFISSRSSVAMGFVPAPGLQVFSGCTVSLDVSVGRSSILNTNSVVSHECKVGDFVTISPSCTVAGRVCIEDDVFLGAGATVKNGEVNRPLTIGKSSVVGAGATVIADVAPGDTVVGVPARSLRKQIC
jgi:sugar O-acyltransferase (sialic acid O-acetyltransferase NeuD family)